MTLEQSLKRFQLEDLSSRLSTTLTELDLPVCETCSSQTDHKGALLLSRDTDYKCRICADPRQFIGRHGQTWTSLRQLVQSGDRYNHFTELIKGKLWTFRTQPSFGIGQRAFLILEQDELLMWDCVAYLDDETLAIIHQLSDGRGLAHLIVSHPHYYSTTVTWTHAFPEMKLWLAAADFSEWHQRGDYVSSPNRLQLVDQVQTPVGKSCVILLLGGHFPGSLVLLWDKILFIADTIQVVPSGLYQSEQPQRPNVASFSFLWSYPNMIPLSPAEVARVCKPLLDVEFYQAYGAFDGFDVLGYAKQKVFESRDIHLQRMSTA